MIFEKKSFTNLYWDKQRKEPFSKGIYSNETLAYQNIKTGENTYYIDTISCQIKWEYNGDFTQKDLPLVDDNKTEKEKVE